MGHGNISRHGKSHYGKPALFFYSAAAKDQFLANEWERDADDDARLRALRQRRSAGQWSQADEELLDEIFARDEERKNSQCEPLRRELEGYFHGLPPLPPPLRKSSEAWRTSSAHGRENAEVRPFFVACEEGSLDDVKQWVPEKREVLRQIGVQEGLAYAAHNNHVDVVRYLLEEGGALLDGSLVEAACSACSLPLFTICLQYGYHPNQQVPSHNGNFGVALNHCLDDEGITRLLLENGADPDLADFVDGRGRCWGSRSTPPMDRKSGLALDRAVHEKSFAVVQMLLEYGANPAYARPLHRVILRRHRAAQLNTEVEWRPLMEMLIRYGANVNARTFHNGTPVRLAVLYKMWDIVEFLLQNGADPTLKSSHEVGDSFVFAARLAGIPWEESEDLNKLLSWLCGSVAGSPVSDAPPIPDEARRNPLVTTMLRMRGIEVNS